MWTSGSLRRRGRSVPANDQHVSDVPQVELERGDQDGNGIEQANEVARRVDLGAQLGEPDRRAALLLGGGAALGEVGEGDLGHRYPRLLE